MDRRGLQIGGIAGLGVSLLIVLGSHNLRHFDWALLPYALATIFSAAAVAYRYTVWLQRPPTWRYWQQGWRLFWQGGLFRNTMHLGGLLFDNFATQRFIGQRSHLRWIMHLCLSWGGMLAFAVTFPLVFGWIHFETPADNLLVYQVFVLGMQVQEFTLDSLPAFLSFNALNFSAILVLVGIALSLHRRLTDPTAMALQQFGNDVLPLLLLFAVAATGLGLTVSARWLHGHGFAFIAITHAVTVIAMLLYLPFGKFFHIFQRPAQLGVAFYKQAAQAGLQATCGRCGAPFASQMQVGDLKQVLDELGMDYRLDGPVTHYQDICPPCRRKLLALSQARTLQTESERVGEREKGRNGDRKREMEKGGRRNVSSQNSAGSPLPSFPHSPIPPLSDSKSNHMTLVHLQCSVRCAHDSPPTTVRAHGACYEEQDG